MANLIQAALHITVPSIDHCRGCKATMSMLHEELAALERAQGNDVRWCIILFVVVQWESDSLRRQLHT
eukprot:32933-Amphidinium_carterae.3